MSSQVSLLRPTTSRPSTSTSALVPRLLFRPRSSPRCRYSSRQLKIVNRSLGDGWKFIREIDTNAVQERLSSWLGKARGVLNEVAAPLVNSAQARSLSVVQSEGENSGVDEVLKAFLQSAELTVSRTTPSGHLSLAALISIEQFGRMNGLTGWKLHKVYEALAPEHLRTDARSLVEYGCFRYLSRDSSEIHPSLKDLAFQRLLFITMLAWQQPYGKDGDSHESIKNYSLQMLVGKDAFIRIAPAIPGVADRSTAHHLFKALAGDESGISLSLWTTYISELVKVHQGRKSLETRRDLLLSTEELVCVSSSRKQPVLKWEENIAWPGNLTLTDSALYFEAIGLTGDKKSIRLDLTNHGSRVEKAKVGPFGSRLFDSAVSVSSGSESETWVLEFVDFGSEMRRDVWHAFISEIISLYGYIHEFGPMDADPSVYAVYGAHKGRKRAIKSAANSIARLQTLQYIRKLSEDPSKLVQFSYLRTVPYGDVVLQALAVKFWGGPLITQFRQDRQLKKLLKPSENISNDSGHVYDIDGSVYLRKWMRSPSWASSSSTLFWRDVSSRKGIVLGKNLIVAGLDIVERAALICKEKSQIMEKTQASIDAAMIQGIPSNIDLFKELMLPLVVVAKNFEKLRRWEDPRFTVCFLVLASTIIFRNLFRYVFPMSFIILGTAMLLMKGLKEQGRLGRYFGKVTIRDQPPSNTIQKIIAVKEAIADFESSLQNVNISLLKIRTIILSGQPEITTEFALVLLSAAVVLLVVPFKYICALILFDLFTRELEFRREMVKKFMTFVREKWVSVQAAPVVVLPYVSEDIVPSNSSSTETIEDKRKLEDARNSSGSPTS